ncbi:MAG: phosphoribosyltransferase [Cyanobacteria bacterium]|jgi:putative phosphoribosyl transferase|nr:phosphoribosyltransferase [Cyanobacteria bacterium GSL.Bin21]
MNTKFRDRVEAGQLLAQKLKFNYANRSDVLVLGLPRGGVPVAFEVAQALNVPLDVCLVRKLGVPGHKELAMGAIAAQEVMVLNSEIVQSLAISENAIERVAAAERLELERRDRAYRGNRPAPEVRDHTIILVDDGVATGSTLKAALSIIKQQEPKQVVIAVPVAPPEVCHQLKAEVDEVVCLIMPEQLYSISLWYEDFSQTTDEEVRYLLKRAIQQSTTAQFVSMNRMED